MDLRDHSHSFILNKENNLFFIQNVCLLKQNILRYLMPQTKKSKIYNNAKSPKNAEFLKQLGLHCQKIRIQRGYSIDRLSKESSGLSSSVIHRLESGSGAVTVTALYRYAQVLGIKPRILFDFDIPELAMNDHKVIRIIDIQASKYKNETFKTLLPFYSLKAAAGYFGDGQDVEPEGWIDVSQSFSGKLTRDMFVAKAVGNSMLPKIKNGALVLFRANPTGSRQGKIVLVQYRGPADPETGGSYTVKEYHSTKTIGPDNSWKHSSIVLKPLNPEFETLQINPKYKDDYKVIAEYLTTI